MVTFWHATSVEQISTADPNTNNVSISMVGQIEEQNMLLTDCTHAKIRIGLLFCTNPAASVCTQGC